MIYSLKSKKKIDLIFEKGVSIKSKCLQIKFYNFKDSEIKFGVSVPKRLFSSAVKGLLGSSVVSLLLQAEVNAKKHKIIIKKVLFKFLIFFML